MRAPDNSRSSIRAVQVPGYARTQNVAGPDEYVTSAEAVRIAKHTLHTPINRVSAIVMKLVIESGNSLGLRTHGRHDLGCRLGEQRRARREHGSKCQEQSYLHVSVTDSGPAVVCYQAFILPQRRQCSKSACAIATHLLKLHFFAQHSIHQPIPLACGAEIAHLLRNSRGHQDIVDLHIQPQRAARRHTLGGCTLRHRQHSNRGPESLCSTQDISPQWQPLHRPQNSRKHLTSNS
jgi:hypothetical protein